MLKQAIGALACASVLISLGGCVHHLSQEECMNMNWKQLGFGDGSAGKYQRPLQNEMSDCSKYKIPVDQTAYHNGWREGTRQFCQSDNGYQLGINGQAYNNVCPAELATKFDRSWHKGLRQYCVPSTSYNLGRSGQAMPNFCAPDQVNEFRNSYAEGFRIYQRQADLQSHVGGINNQISYAQNQIDNKNRDINHWQKVLDGQSGQPITPDVREQAYSSIRNDRNDIFQLQRQLSDLQAQQSDLQNQITQLQAS